MATILININYYNIKLFLFSVYFKGIIIGVYYKYIIKSKPGLTGLWQVSGRSNLTFEDRLKLDEEYSNRQGNIRDFKILIKTFHKVFGEEGAI